MPKHILSKSTFIRGQQCLKSLYLYKNRNYLKDAIPPEQLAKFSRGWDVNELALGMYPGGVDVSPPSQKAVARTFALMVEGQPVIYEAAFLYDDVLIAIDILVKTGNGWKAVEVKSSRSLSETYFKDAFLQYYVIAGSGVELVDFQLVHINPGYVRNGELDLEQLFVHRSVKLEAEEKLGWVKEQIAIEKQVISAGKSPSIDIGRHCNYPYPCDFHGLCWKKIPAGSVFSLDEFTEDEKFGFYSQSHLLPHDLPESLQLTPRQQIVVKTHRMGGVYIDNTKISKFVETFERPAAIISMLSFTPAVPLFDGTSPYQSMVFAFGCLIVGNSPEGHDYQEFIVPIGINPLDVMPEKLKKNIEDLKSVMVFGKNDFDFSLDVFDTINILDLKSVFSEKSYYSPALAGASDCLDVFAALSGESPDEPREYFSDILAGVAYNSLSVTGSAVKPKDSDSEISKLGKYCRAKAMAIKGIADFLERAALASK